MLGEPLGWDSDDSECEERMDNCGFTFDEVNELLCQVGGRAGCVQVKGRPLHAG